MDHQRGTIVWEGRETYRPLRHRIEHRIYTDLQGVRWRKEAQEAQLFNETLSREETIRHQVAVLEPRTPDQVVEGRLKCRPFDRIVVVVEKLYHSDGIRALVRIRNEETRVEKYFRRNESKDDDMVYNLVIGAKFAIGETMGHTSLPDTMGNLEDIVKNFPKDPELEHDKALEVLTEQTKKWLKRADSPPSTSATSSGIGTEEITPGQQALEKPEEQSNQLLSASQATPSSSAMRPSSSPVGEPHEVRQNAVCPPPMKEFLRAPVKPPLDIREYAGDHGLIKPVNLEIAKVIDWSALAGEKSPCASPKGYSTKPKPLLDPSTSLKTLPTPKEVIADLHRISAGCPTFKKPACCPRAPHRKKGLIIQQITTIRKFKP